LTNHWEFAQPRKRSGGAGRGTFQTLIWMGCWSAPVLVFCQGFLVKASLGV